MSKLKVIEHTCDVCVVGGGLAGCMAAIRAERWLAEQGIE